MQNDFVQFDPENLTITVRGGMETLIIGREDVQISWFSGGPGGQNVNKTMNGVRLIYRIPEECRRNGLKTREIVTRCINQRSREQNLAEAFAQLAQKIRQYFYVPPHRLKTKTPKRAKEKRLRGKKLQGMKKQERRGVGNFP